MTKGNTSRLDSQCQDSMLLSQNNLKLCSDLTRTVDQWVIDILKADFFQSRSIVTNS